MKVLPEDIDIDLKDLQDKIEKTLQEEIKDTEGVHQLCQLVKCVEEPIAFGLKAFKVTMLIPDKSGLIDELDNKMSSIPHVNSVETLSVSRGL